MLGIVLTAAGIALAILYCNRGKASEGLEAIKGSLSVGVAISLGAATGQALGILIARPLMTSGIDPFVASLVRVGVAAACLSVLLQLPFEGVRAKEPLNCARR